MAAGEIQKKTPLKQAHLNAMQQQGRAQQTLPPPLNALEVAWIEESGINALSLLTEGINLVEKKGEDQNYLPITFTFKGKKQPFFLTPRIVRYWQDNTVASVHVKVLSQHRGELLEPHTKRDNPSGKRLSHGASGGICRPYHNTWVA